MREEAERTHQRELFPHHNRPREQRFSEHAASKTHPHPWPPYVLCRCAMRTREQDISRPACMHLPDG